MPLRPHHICCTRFWKESFPERGEGYLHAEAEIKKAVETPSDTILEANEGTDILCRQCPNCTDNRCASPLGDENEVRKWDALLLRELELPYGTRLTSREWQERVAEKIPFQLCRKCHWQQVCRVGEQLL